MSNYVALYRKYRPETFEDVVGQEPVVDLLLKAIRGSKLAHAYLFCGARGTGKTSVARIFARDVGCNSEDIIEIDAASNRGIDEIRELREAVRSVPFSSQYKVYIIDEVHMLTKEAANALLKTLEEPPKHVIFILATTDPDKLPQTIVSRCQKVEFKQPSIETLSSRLIYVAKKESKILEQDGAYLIATHGKGSYRDALGVLEQVLTRFTDKTITKDIVGNLLGAPSEKLILLLLESVCKQDNKSTIELLNEAKSKNILPNILYKELIEYMRLALLARIGGESIANHGLLDVQVSLKDLGIKYPLVINSTKVLSLLESEKYLRLPNTDGYLSLEMILISK